MLISLRRLLLATSLLSTPTLLHAISAKEVPADTPISSLLASANAHLARGETQDALVYYDLAITRDPANYLSHFRRGAAYLSIGRTQQAAEDFDRVLVLRPDHEQARLQRAKIRGRHGEWEGARQDYNMHGGAEAELAELSEAQGAASLAFEAEKGGRWEECITQSGAAILVAAKLLSLRRTRASCRFMRGEVEEGMSDLKHVLQMQPGLTEPHVQISAISFYALAHLEQGLDQMRKCLHSDPDSKSCKKLYRRQKTLEKQIGQVDKHFERKQFASGLKVLNPSGEDPGLLQDVRDDIADLKKQGTIPEQAPNGLLSKLAEMVCQAYYETKSPKAAGACKEALALDEHSLHGLLHQAQSHADADSFEAAISTLEKAKEHHPEQQQIIGQKIHDAQVALKRSKTKDYYKVLGLQRDADEVQIKAAYRKMVKIHHPDKALKKGLTKEEAEKKMASINEAYEVLSDPQLKARFDQGDDPNDHTQQHQNPFQQGGFQFQGNPFAQGGPFAGGGFGGGGQHFNFKFG